MAIENALNNRRTRIKKSLETMILIVYCCRSLETMFLIVICRQSGDKWQSKTLLLTIFDLHSSIVLMFLIDPIQCGKAYLKNKMSLALGSSPQSDIVRPRESIIDSINVFDCPLSSVGSILKNKMLIDPWPSAVHLRVTICKTKGKHYPSLYSALIF